MDKLKKNIKDLLKVSTTEPLNRWEHYRLKREINRIFFPLKLPILKLEGFCGLNNPSAACYLNSSLQLLFRIDTFTNLLDNFNHPEELNYMDLKSPKNTDAEKRNILYKEKTAIYNKIKDLLNNNNYDVKNLYNEYLVKKNEIDELNKSLIDFDNENNCSNHEKFYGKFILENMVLIYNLYKSIENNNSISLNDLKYKQESVYQNLIDIAFNKKDDTVPVGKITTTGYRQTISTQNHTSEFLFYIFKYLVCFNNNLVSNFIKSINFKIKDYYQLEDNSFSKPMIKNYQTYEIKLGQLAVGTYSFQEVIDSNQSEIFTDLINTGEYSKEDSYDKLRYTAILDLDKYKNNVGGDREIIRIRSYYNSKIDEINSRYSRRAKLKKLEILIPDELEYLIVNIERRNMNETQNTFFNHQVISNTFQIGGNNFVRKAVTIHSGGVGGGHYVCAVCNDEGYPIKLLNDSSVSDINDVNIRQPLDSVSSNGYIRTIPQKGISYLFKRIVNHQ